MLPTVSVELMSHSRPREVELAERIERWARTVGSENLVVGNDCGFASTAGNPLPAASGAARTHRVPALHADFEVVDTLTLGRIGEGEGQGALSAGSRSRSRRDAQTRRRARQGGSHPKLEVGGGRTIRP